MLLHLIFQYRPRTTSRKTIPHGNKSVQNDKNKQHNKIKWSFQKHSQQTAVCVAVVGRQQQQTPTQKIRNVCITETGTALQLDILEVQINLNYQTTKEIIGRKMEPDTPSICLNYVLLLLCQRVVLYIFSPWRTQWRDKWGPFGAYLGPPRVCQLMSAV